MLCLFYTNSAQAIPVFFTDRAAFVAAAGGLEGESFETSFSSSPVVSFDGFDVMVEEGDVSQARNFSFSDGTNALTDS